MHTINHEQACVSALGGGRSNMCVQELIECASICSLGIKPDPRGFNKRNREQNTHKGYPSLWGNWWPHELRSITLILTIDLNRTTPYQTCLAKSFLEGLLKIQCKTTWVNPWHRMEKCKCWDSMKWSGKQTSSTTYAFQIPERPNINMY